MPEKSNLKVQSVAHGCSLDGRIVTLTFADKDRSSVTIECDAGKLPSLYFLLETAAESARALQIKSLKGSDPRLMNPVHVKTVTALGGAVSMEGVPILDIEINGKMRLSLALGLENLQTLIEFLQGLESEAQTPPPKPN
ncbi:MAG: hypothetical protein RIB41_04965 [Oceanibaculum nanhaiense]|jgi:hypothetical protein|uniref:hypothetical protein n=1 Tax=Oceanibaculum nanhaiense TaxID=1909734 RepID=UPI0032ED4CA5